MICFSATTTSPTIWAGTNSGQVLVFLLTIPTGEEKRKDEKVTATLAKEIQMKHRAPVLTIQVLDQSGMPGVSSEGPHKVFIATEEQFTLKLLPNLKPCGKYKLTAHEGARVRKIGFTTFVSKADSSYSETCLTCLTNQGDLAIHSLPELKRQSLQTECMRKEDVIGISTLVFTPKGEAFYLASSSEMARVSMSAALNLQAKGTLQISSEVRHEMVDNAPVPVKKDSTASRKVIEVPVKKTSTSEDDTEAATVARQNQLNEQQAQGTKLEFFFLSFSRFSRNLSILGSKSPVTNGTDPHNETTVSEISADITIDSVKDHTV